MTDVKSKGLGVAPVYFTAIATILGAILFLRFGYAVGTLGFWGVILIVLLGHMVTIPTALALSEIATNRKVEGGGEYFIISRSFGLNIGATIGIALYFSQAISVAFYVIAFTEAFYPFFNWFNAEFGFELPRQVISIPVMAGLSVLILKKGANMGVKILYIVVGILLVSLVLFFAGSTEYYTDVSNNAFVQSFRNSDNFFIVFAIIFPAFTGMTAGVGLSGELRKPSKSIPLGTVAGTLTGLVIYLFITWKFAVSASPEDLISDQMIMSKIAIGGAVVIPLGLAASTISSALGSVMVAPRTIQALSKDQSLPGAFVNRFLAKEKGENKEPFNATLVTVVIAFVFVAMGDVNAVAEIISMFFMITYGSLNLISFLYHFGADPSYMPSFKTNKLVSLTGFILCLWLMFMMNSLYAIGAILLLGLFYVIISRTHKERGGLQAISMAALSQISSKIHLFAQRTKKSKGTSGWRPSVICISSDSFEREKPIQVMGWISHKYGFGTYIHLIKGYYSKETHIESKNILDKLLELTNNESDKIFIDTLISPSYTSAVAQAIQLPSVSGEPYNMILFEYPKESPERLEQIFDNINLVQAGEFDVGILESSIEPVQYINGIHVWIQKQDFANANMMILIAYIIHSHPLWRKGQIKIYYISDNAEIEENRNELIELIDSGRFPVSKKNIETISIDKEPQKVIAERSADAGLTIIGFNKFSLKHDGINVFSRYSLPGDILFMNTESKKELK